MNADTCTRRDAMRSLLAFALSAVADTTAYGRSPNAPAPALENLPPAPGMTVELHLT
jgi:hypothetical protein